MLNAEIGSVLPDAPGLTRRSWDEIMAGPGAAIISGRYYALRFEELS